MVLECRTAINFFYWPMIHLCIVYLSIQSRGYIYLSRVTATHIGTKLTCFLCVCVFCFVFLVGKRDPDPIDLIRIL